MGRARLPASRAGTADLRPAEDSSRFADSSDQRAARGGPSPSSRCPWTAAAGARRDFRRVRLRSPGSLGPGASRCGAAVVWLAASRWPCLAGLRPVSAGSRDRRPCPAQVGARAPPRAQGGLHAGYSAQAALGACGLRPACRGPACACPGAACGRPARGARRAGPHVWLLRPPAPPPALPPRPRPRTHPPPLG